MYLGSQGNGEDLRGAEREEIIVIIYCILRKSNFNKNERTWVTNFKVHIFVYAHMYV